jgi:hypothetical protein
MEYVSKRKLLQPADSKDGPDKGGKRLVTATNRRNKPFCKHFTVHCKFTLTSTCYRSFTLASFLGSAIATF